MPRNARLRVERIRELNQYLTALYVHLRCLDACKRFASAYPVRSRGNIFKGCQAGTAPQSDRLPCRSVGGRLGYKLRQLAWFLKGCRNYSLECIRRTSTRRL